LRTSHRMKYRTTRTLDWATLRKLHKSKTPFYRRNSERALKALHFQPIGSDAERNLSWLAIFANLRMNPKALTLHDMDARDGPLQGTTE